ncbi:MAG: hypothetical protein WC674_01945 [Candidatus Krumholzibacteriia bacterium]
MKENAGENAIAEAGESRTAKPSDGSRWIAAVGYVGFIVIGLFYLVTALAALILSLAGFLKALFGDDWKMPFLGEYREKVPGLHWQEG